MEEAPYRFANEGFAFNNPPSALLPNPCLSRYAHVRPPTCRQAIGRISSTPFTGIRRYRVAQWQARYRVPIQPCVTTYQLLVFGHTADGRIGSLTKTIEARLPFTLEPKLPLEVTAGDRIDMPVSVANNTAESRSVRMQLETANMKMLDELLKRISLGKPRSSSRCPRPCHFRCSRRPVEGEAQIVVEGFSARFAIA